MPLDIGAAAPGFVLPGADGREWSPGGAASVVCFVAEDCPASRGWHPALLALAADHAGAGVVVVLVEVAGDEAAAAARWAREGPWPAAYAVDAAGTIARAYHVEVTPHAFVLDSDGRLRYRGAPGPEPGDASWLRGALALVLSGEPVVWANTEPVGTLVPSLRGSAS